jgi:hypothetical protein
MQFVREGRVRPMSERADEVELLIEEIASSAYSTGRVSPQKRAALRRAIELGEERALAWVRDTLPAKLADAKAEGAREEREAADELLYAVELWFDRNLNTLEETDGANALVASIEEFRARGKADKP